MRNYKAMGNEKLARTLREFDVGDGEAIVKAGDVALEHQIVKGLAFERGLISDDPGKEFAPSPPRPTPSKSAPKLLPMLLHEAEKQPDADGRMRPVVPTGDGWVIERKADGWRFLWRVTETGIQSYAGRNGSDYTGQAAAVEAALAYLPPGTILDGELVVGDGRNQDDVAVSSVLATPAAGQLRAIVFDVLAVAGSDVTNLPWSERRQLLEKAAEGFDGVNVVLSEVYPASQALADEWIADGYEGAVCKRTSSRYCQGTRSHDWLKVKPQQTADAVVIGFKEGKNGNVGKLSAFKIRMLDTGTESSVGTLDDAMMNEVTANPDAFLGRGLEIRCNGRHPSGAPKHATFGIWRPEFDEAPGATAEGVAS